MENTTKTNFIPSTVIAFREHDIDGDKWSEKVWLFKSQSEANEFFKMDNPIIVEHYTDEDDRIITNWNVETSELNDSVTFVSFDTEYAGEVKLYRMLEGILIQKL